MTAARASIARAAAIQSEPGCCRPATYASSDRISSSPPITRQQLERLRAGRRSVAGVHRSWGALNEAQGAWLTKQGVSLEAILEPTPIGATWVRFFR